MIAQGKIIKRLLGQPSGTTDPNIDSNLSYDTRADHVLLRPSSTQTAHFPAGPSLTCLDTSPNGLYAIVAGEKVFKSLKVNGTAISEEVDLRAAISTHASTHGGHGDTLSAFNDDQLNIKSIRWAHQDLDTTIFTASANGRITLYDLNRVGSGLEVGRIRDHARQVHKLDINAWKSAWLLSASQDGTARLFDIKAPGGRNGLTFHSKAMFKCNADAVRDIKWSPKDVFSFACCTASGTIQQWDARKPIAPVLKINAHDSACLSISWHPDGEHIVSGGFDQKCHVWNLSKTAEKRQKPKYSFATPAPVSIVSWRPPCWSSSAQHLRAAQIAVVYEDSNSIKTQNSTVHIWDIARPSLPFKELAEYQTSPTGIIWHQRDLLWTVEREGYFKQVDVAFAPKVIDRRSLSTFDFSPAGEVLMLLEKRQGRARYSMSSGVDIPSHARGNGIMSQDVSPEGQLGMSRSDSDEDVGGSFLGPRPRSRKPGRRPSTKSVSSLSSTPPSANGTVEGTVLNLDEIVEKSGSYKPQQVMAIGHAPSAMGRDTFRYLSARYLHRMAKDIQRAITPGVTVPSISERMASILEHFAKSAESVGHYRLGQTWRILSYTMVLLLNRRAAHHRQLRLTRYEEKQIIREKQEKQELKDHQRRADQKLFEDTTPSKMPRSSSPMPPMINPAMKHILADDMESTSNMNTPLARPMRDSMIMDSKTSNKIPPLENDVFHLTSTVEPPKPKYSPVDTPPIPAAESGTFSSEDGYDFYDMASLTTAAIDITVPPRKPPFRLDYDAGQSASSARHNSIESFQMFSTSGDSRRKFPSSEESGGRRGNRNPPQQSEIDSSWESSEASSIPRHLHSFESEEGHGSNNGRPSLGPSSLSNSPPVLRVQHALMSSAHGGRFDDDLGSATDVGSVNPPESDINEESPELLDIDYRPQLKDPSFMPEAIDPHLLIKRTIKFETQSGSLNAALMILLLTPHLIHGTIDENQAPAILQQYHQRLTSMMLFNEAAILRKISYPTYPTVYGQGQEKNGLHMGYYCTTCKKPLKNGKLYVGSRLQHCERCKSYLDGCSVCRLQETPPESFPETEEPDIISKPFPSTGDIDYSSPGARIWWWCQGCSHGGHTACIRAWHSGGFLGEGSDFSDGACPVEGCLHPCLTGKWREEVISVKSVAKNEELNRLVKEGTRSGKGVGGRTGLGGGNVKRDGREVTESRAVESVRGALAGTGVGVERERKKSVKVVAPGEEFTGWH